jgi:hypothetical protein
MRGTMRAWIAAAFAVLCGCQGASPEAGDAGVSVPPDASRDFGSCSGRYTCTEVGIASLDFPVELFDQGGVCRAATITGSYALDPDGTVTLDGAAVASWFGTPSAFVLDVPPSSFPLNEGTARIACALSTPLPPCGGEGGACPSPVQDDAGESNTDGAYPEPPDGGAVTWDDWVSGFSSAYCVSCHTPSAPCSGSLCHVPSDPALYLLAFDIREKSQWTERAGIIQCGVAASQPSSWTCLVPAETFPKMELGAPLPSDAERAIVVDWFDAGCP